MPAKPRVFDSWALLAFVQDEPGAPKVEALLAEASEQGLPALVSVVNLGEVWYTTARTRGDSQANATVDALLSLGLVVVPADWELAQQAARFKARHKLAFGDCFAAALAKQRDIEVVTGDPEFRQLSREVRILWL
ncbi:MAG TPA: type II toxin-antitoxin system VapC family toxin [Planctomycetota bacterium]|nr:type II toxin-antitoxin system VapC family toxin [Planctomycetota bacterium]